MQTNFDYHIKRNSQIYTRMADLETEREYLRSFSRLIQDAVVDRRVDLEGKIREIESLSNQCTQSAENSARKRVRSHRYLTLPLKAILGRLVDTNEHS